MKEAQFALDLNNPLDLYNCLVPEIAAFRPLKLERMMEENRKVNYLAQLQLERQKTQNVSTCA